MEAFPQCYSVQNSSATNYIHSNAQCCKYSSIQQVTPGTFGPLDDGEEFERREQQGWKGILVHIEDHSLRPRRGATKNLSAAEVRPDSQYDGHSASSAM